MKIGLLGAGKVGFSLGRYFSEHHIPLAGYYSRNTASAQEAADFTDSAWFSRLKDLVHQSDLLFVTTGDDALPAVWEQLRNLPLENKMICHCSGSLSSGIFSEAHKTGCSVYSVHPLVAVSDRYTGYHALAKAVFTIEGDDEHLDELVALFTAMGNRVQTIDRHQKALYHCAAVTVSNHVLALLDWGVELLVRCGFAQEQALSVLSPLIRGNVEAALCRGVTDALTGPVERGDTATITNHLRALSDHPDEQLLYKLLAGRLVEVARRKHPQRDDSELRTMLGGLF